MRPLPLTAEHVLGVAELPPLHRDPFDRALVAQARAEGLTLVTADPLVQAYQVSVLAVQRDPIADGGAGLSRGAARGRRRR